MKIKFFSKKLAKDIWRHEFIHSFNKYPRCKNQILFLRAFTGCDSTSSLFKKGKLQIIKIFDKNIDLCQSALQSLQENCLSNILCEHGIRILLARYNAPRSELNIDKYRHIQFIKATRLNRPVQLSSLPLTSAAARQHIHRGSNLVGEKFTAKSMGIDFRERAFTTDNDTIATSPRTIAHYDFLQLQERLWRQLWVSESWVIVVNNLWSVQWTS